MSDNQGRYGDLPVFPSSWDAEHLDFPSDGDFEKDIEKLVLQGELEDSLDEAMRGQSSPRIWLLVHEPGQGALSAVSALYFARELASRDQGVLILDCDETDPTLTRWAGQVGTEGWADMARYGASVLTCGISLPFPGRHGYLLGPGSYSPVDIQPSEIEQILSRLRRQADDIILVCPLGEAGRWWAPAAQIRILCWNTASTGEDRIETIVEGMNLAETPLTGLIRFGSPTVVEPKIEQAIESETEPDPQDEQADTVEPELVPDDGGESPAEDRPVEISPAEVLPTEIYARKRGTSRVFWWVAMGAVCLIAMSAWYYFEYVREPLPDAGPGGRSPVAAIEPDVADPVEVAGPVEVALDQSEKTDPAPDSQEPMTMEAPDSVTPENVPADLDTEGDSEPAQEPEKELASEVEIESEAGVEGVFYMDPYLVPVGSDGWALHLFSFPDEKGTLEEVKILERKGFMTETRSVQIKGKGRWHRIYLGSFSTRAKAQEALDPLLKELGQDWGRPTEF